MALQVVIPLVMVATLGAWIWAIIDIGRYRPLEWEASGQSPVMWVLIVVFLGILGLILYLTIARPRLKSSLMR